MEMSHPDKSVAGGKVFGGAVLMLLGLLLMTGRLGWSGFVFSTGDWAFVFLGLGLFRLVYPAERAGRRASRRFGAWLTLLGCWGLLNEFGVFGFHYGASWPLLVVGTGLNIVWRSLESERGGHAREQ